MSCRQNATSLRLSDSDHEWSRIKACTACQTARSAERISWRDGPRSELSDGTARANDKNLSLNLLITSRCTFSNIASAVANTDSGFEESTEQLAVGAGAARVMPRDGVRLRAA